jgi:hypothetical protein
VRRPALGLPSVSILFLSGARRVGPCSVAALKSGALALQWDTPAMYRVVNGELDPKRKNLPANSMLQADT